MLSKFMPLAKVLGSAGARGGTAGSVAMGVQLFADIVKLATVWGWPAKAGCIGYRPNSSLCMGSEPSLSSKLSGSGFGDIPFVKEDMEDIGDFCSLARFVGFSSS